MSTNALDQALDDAIAFVGVVMLLWALISGQLGHPLDASRLEALVRLFLAL